MLELARASVAYARVPALREVDIRVEEGECVAVLGANGAGKSSMLRAISGLVPYGGEVRFAGSSLRGRPPFEIARLGIAHVPEGRRVFPEMTVEENLLVSATAGAARAKRTDSIARVWDLFPELRARRAQRAGTLSGGEQQMLAVGRGLVMAPTLLLLDEPSLGLAPVVVGRLFERLADIHRQGLAFLLVEQNVQRALHLADRCYVLEAGSVALQGRSEEVLATPRVREAYLGM